MKNVLKNLYNKDWYNIIIIVNIIDIEDSQMSLFEWKGQTFNQIVSTIKHNINHGAPSKHDIFRALPAKLYRKELVPSDSRNISITTMLQPGGATKTSTYDCNTTLDINLTNNTTETDKHAIYGDNPCYIPVHDALNRVRSAKKMQPGYNSSASQYLVNKGISFKQQQITHARDSENYYVPGGSNTCLSDKPCSTTVFKPSNKKFGCQGGVSSAARLDRLKYDTITTVAGQATTSLGQAAANAMSYRSSLSQQGMTKKDKLGYPHNYGCEIGKCTM